MAVSSKGHAASTKCRESILCWVSNDRINSQLPYPVQALGIAAASI